MEKLDVVIPIYNTDKYLRQCIESVINQTYKNLEIILVDDGSTDNSGRICDEYAKMDDRIKVLHQENQGAILARMNGLKLVGGKYVTFVDSDDFVDLKLFEKLMQPLNNNKRIDISISPFTMYESGKYICHFKKYDASEINVNVARRLIYESKHIGWSMYAKIYKTKLFKNIRISNTANAYGEDIEFNWKILKKVKTAYYISFSGYYYRQHSESMIHKSNFLTHLGVFNRLKKALFDKDVKDFETKKYIGKMLCNTRSQFIINHLKTNSDYNSVKEYQKILKKIFYLYTKDLNPFEVNRCRLALINCHKLYKTINRNNDNLVNAYKRLYKKSKNIFIYGAGLLGKDVADILHNNNLSYLGFVVSKKNDKNDAFSFDEICKKYGGDCAFMVAMNEGNTNEVKPALRDVKHEYVGKYSLYYS